MPALRENLVAQRSSTITIANGQTVSSAFDARGFSSFGLVMPAAFTGTTLTFQVSHDNSTFQELLTNTGATLSITVTASKSYALPAQLAAWRYFKVVSGSAEGAARTLTIMASAVSAPETAATSIGVTTVGAITPGTSATSLGKAEDAAHASGDTGVMLLGVRNDNLTTTLSGTNGDYTPIATDSLGQQFIIGNTLFTSDGTFATSRGIPVLAPSYAFNGSNWDRQRSNETGTVFATSGRTATTNSSDLINYNGRGVVVHLYISAVSGSASVTVKIQSKEPVTAGYEDLLTSEALTGTGTFRFVVYPGIDAITNRSVNNVIGRTFRVRVEHANADSITYAAGYSALV